MHLHLHLPGFQAFACQVHERALRRRPVVVAVSPGVDAPILSCSREAWACGLQPGQRVDEARRLCPDLIVRLPQADQARRLQADVAEALLAWSPLLASSPGRWDLDLDGVHDFWGARLAGARVDDPAHLAWLIAEQLRQRLRDDLGHAPQIGIGRHPLEARLAARLAGARGIARVADADEARALDALPLQVLPASASLRDQLVFMHCLTIGDVRRLGLDGLATVGGGGGRALHAALNGCDQVLPASLDGEANLSVASGTGAGGADARGVLPLLHGLAQQLGHLLRRGHLAATRLGLTVKWGIGITRRVALTPTYQVRSDRDLVHLAECLLVQAGEERLPWSWLRLTATGLVAAEEQHELFILATTPWGRQPLPARSALPACEPTPVAGHALIAGD